MAIFIPIALTIVLTTGWLSFLPTEIKMSKSQLVFGLLMISCLSLMPSIPISSTVEIHLVSIILFGIWIVMLTRLPIERIYILGSLMLMMGSILFLYQEAVGEFTRNRFYIEWFTVLFSISEAIIASSCLRERISLIFGGLIIAQGGTLYINYDRLSPIVLLGDRFLLLFWLSLVFLLFLHRFLLTVPKFRDWGLPIWIKRR